MKKNYTIWIGLPAFNEEKAIEDVLKSIKKLKLKNTKILIFNDGSKDKTVELILGLGKKQFLEISKCFFISNLQLLKTDSLLKSLDLFFAIILSATSF